jgi:hypothetical protein
MSNTLKEFVLKVDLVLLAGLIGACIPIWNQLSKILDTMKAEAAARAETDNQIKFILQRLTRLEEFISRNSELR